MDGREYLIMVLQAPMMSYGSIAVDNKRPTDTVPGRSMLTGLLGNALGYRREESDLLGGLQDRIRHSARTERLGDSWILRDYHTAMLDRKDKAWTTYGEPDGRAGGRKTLDSPEPRDVHYLVEKRTVVALTLAPGDGPSLEDLAQALQWPFRPLYIGRRTCVPERPMYETLLSAESGGAALDAIPGWRDGIEAEIQWEAKEPAPDAKNVREVHVSDLRDWRNGVHVGRRTVMRGTQTLASPAAGGER